MKLGPWPLGMNNRQADHALPIGAFRNGVNVDVDKLGNISLRAGTTKVYDGVDTKFGWGCKVAQFFVENKSLMRFNDNDTATKLYDGIYGSHCTYWYFNGIVYFSDGIVSLKIYPDNTVTNWGIARPSSPVLSATGGTLPSGEYVAAVAFYDSNGVESGASDIVEITCSGGIRFQSIPTSSDPQVVGIRLFLSAVNGDTLFQVADLSLGVASYNVVVYGYDSDRFSETLFIGPPPPSQIITFFKSSLFMASGSDLYKTDDYSLDHVSHGESYNQFAEDITIALPVNDGMYIVSDKTYFYGGSGPRDFVEVKGFEYGAHLGSGQIIPNTNEVAWDSHRGMIIGGPGGAVRNIVEENVATHKGDSAQTLIKEFDGKQHFISSIKNSTISTAVAQSFMTTEIIRKG